MAELVDAIDSKSVVSPGAMSRPFITAHKRGRRQHLRTRRPLTIIRPTARASDGYTAHITAIADSQAGQLGGETLCRRSPYSPLSTKCCPLRPRQARDRDGGVLHRHNKIVNPLCDRTARPRPGRAHYDLGSGSSHQPICHTQFCVYECFVVSISRSLSNSAPIALTFSTSFIIFADCSTLAASTFSPSSIPLNSVRSFASRSSSK